MGKIILSYYILTFDRLGSIDFKNRMCSCINQRRRKCAAVLTRTSKSATWIAWEEMCGRQKNIRRVDYSRRLGARPEEGQMARVEKPLLYQSFLKEVIRSKALNICISTWCWSKQFFVYPSLSHTQRVRYFVVNKKRVCIFINKCSFATCSSLIYNSSWKLAIFNLIILPVLPKMNYPIRGITYRSNL